MKSDDRVLLYRFVEQLTNRPRPMTAAEGAKACGFAGTPREFVVAMDPAVKAQRLERTLVDGVWRYSLGELAVQPMPDDEPPAATPTIPAPSPAEPATSAGRTVAGVVIRRDVPPPDRIVRGVRSSWRIAAEDLAVGESYEFPVEHQKQVKAAVTRLQSISKGARRFLIRRVTETHGGVWRTA